MAKAGIDLEAELDGVYRSPLSDFVAARDALALRLKSSGDADAAARVKALKKPSVPAWAVNQVRFTAPRLVAALLAAGDRFRSRPPDVAAAMAARREALATARAKAEELLTASGHAATPETMRRVAATLEALATYGTSPGRPVAGRLTEELAAPGFDDLAALGILHGAAGAKPRGDRPRTPAPGVRPPARATGVRSDEKKEAREKRAREVVAAKAKEAERARVTLLEAEGRAESLRRKRQELETALTEARRHERAHAAVLEAARAASRRAERAARAAGTGRRTS